MMNKGIYAILSTRSTANVQRVLEICKTGILSTYWERHDIFVCILYPGEGFFRRFLNLPNFYSWAVILFLLNHPSIFWGRISFPLSSSAALLVHQNDLLCFVELGLLINAKVYPPKSPRPRSVCNEIKWRIKRKSPASGLFFFHF